MKKRSILQKIFAAALAVTMMGTMVPAAAQAAENDASSAIIAQFDFDNETDGFAGGGAKASGTYTLTDSYSTETGKALYLDGTSQFLNVTKEDGSSLLSGLKTMTVSFEMKSDRTSTNWPFYAAPSLTTQPIGGDGKELYFGLLVNGGNITAERYLNGRSSCASTAMNSGWSHVDVVVSEADTTIYIDGMEKSRVASTSGLDSILGTSGILQIGKANWGNGEYCKGWIDNMTIYNRALSTEEVLASIPASYKSVALDEAEKGIAEITISDSKTALPDYGGTVTWKSDMEEIVIGENGISAVVAQPAKGEEAVSGALTAVITLLGEKREVKVPVTIMPGVDADDAYGYLMVHFVEDSAGYQEKIYLDISRGDNPQQWDPLNGRQPIAVSNLGTTGARDPFITYNPETETYYIIATDLRVFGADNGGWGAWSTKGSTKMNVWESKDLIQWSDVRQFDVTLNKEGEKVAELGMMWAPEATWVPDYYGEGKGAFVVYWSSNEYELTDTEHKNSLGSNIMWGATPDFTQETFEYGGMFLDGGNAGWIDTNILQNNGKTYHITKSHAEQIIMEVTEAKDWWNYETTEWTRVQSRIGESRYGSVEGPATFVDHSRENSFYLFVDDLPQPGYQPMYSSNLEEGWDYLDSENYFLTSMTKHGGVISLTKAQYDAIRDADAVSAVEENLAIVQAAKGLLNTEELMALLPADAEVNLAYNRGTSNLPVQWDLSTVNTGEAGTYTVTGVVQTIGANRNQWIGKNDSTNYLAEDKQLYSSTEIKVTVVIEVTEDEPKELPYVDITKEHWGYDAVAYNYYAGTMTGKDETHFAPDDPLKRAQFAAVLYKMNESPDVEFEEAFPDVPANVWCADCVTWALDNGIVTGYTDTNTFRPDNDVTRAELATMLYRYAKNYKKYDVSTEGDYSTFPDAADVQKFAEEAVNWAVGEGIITGKTIDEQLMICPNGTATRAECATMIQRYMELYEK